MTTPIAVETDPHAQRRAMVQASATRTLKKREIFSRSYFVLLVVALFIAFIPLGSILWNVISKGIHVVSATYLTTTQGFPTIADRNNIGGISNAISGSLIIDGLAILIAIPLSVVLAIALFEIDNKLFRGLRTFLEVMIGLPSILIGVFIYTFVVVPVSHGVGTAWAGSLAIAMLMTPLMAIAGEAALRGVPSTLQEAGLALGGRPSSVMRRVILPFAFPRILTGILLSMSRAVGETAPLLVITGVSYVTNWNPGQQATSLPVMIYGFINSQYPAVRNSCWGIALVLMTAVLVLNLSSRLIVARTSKGQR